MLFWRFSRASSGILGISKRYRGKPRENPSHINNGETDKTTQRTEACRTCGGIKSICRTIRRKSSPFYALMKKLNDKFEWTEDADIAFAQLEKVLSTPPVSVAPREKKATTTIYGSYTSSGKHGTRSRAK
jgi:hypothetical protein